MITSYNRHPSSLENPASLVTKPLSPYTNQISSCHNSPPLCCWPTHHCSPYSPLANVAGMSALSSEFWTPTHLQPLPRIIVVTRHPVAGFNPLLKHVARFRCKLAHRSADGLVVELVWGGSSSSQTIVGEAKNLCWIAANEHILFAQYPSKNQKKNMLTWLWRVGHKPS